MTFVGATVNVHGGGVPACVTVKTWPAIVNVPVRGDVAVFGATENRTVPLPVPDAPTTTESHPTLPAAVHSQRAGVFTLTEIVPPDASTDSDVLDSAKVHTGGVGDGGVGPGGFGGGVPSAAD